MASRDLTLHDVEILTKRENDADVPVGFRIDGHDIVIPRDSEIRVTSMAGVPSVVSIDLIAATVRYVPEDL